MSVSMDLGGRHFSTKAAAKRYFQDIQRGAMKRGMLPQPITDQTEISVIKDLLETHAHHEEKVGSGNPHFFVDYTTSHPDSARTHRERPSDVCIFIKRADGSEIDFSWRHLIDNYKVSPLINHQNRVKKALRSAIEGKREEFRENAFKNNTPVTCPRTGKRMTDFDQAEVVYESPSWSELTEAFVSQEGGWENIELSEPSSHIQLGKELSSPDVKARWIAFWQQNARPLIVSKS